MKRVLIGIGVLVLLVAGVVAGWYLVGQRQLFGKKAAVSGGTAQVRLSLETNSVQVGSSFPVSILFSTGPSPISAVTIQLDYDYTGTEPPLGVSNIALDSSLLATGEWSIPIKTFTADNGHARVRIAAINTSLNGFTSVSDVQLATLTFLANNLGTINVTFDATESKVTTKAGGNDVLLVPTSTGAYSVVGIPTVTPGPTSGAVGATSTPTPGPTSVPGPTSTPAPTSTPTPTTSTGGSSTSGEAGVTPTPTLSELPKSGLGDMTVGVVGVGMLLIVIGALAGFVI